jgi:hypothetical protein
MKHLLFLLLFATMFACNSKAPKAELVVPEEQAKTASKAAVEFEGPNVDLMKKLIASVEQGDWEAAQSCFADSAMNWYNAWPMDTAQKGTPAKEVLAFEKSDRVNWTGVDYGDPIYEVVITPDGQKYGHAWVRFRAKNVKSGKNVDVPAFLSFHIVDGKIQSEWAFYDSKKME